MTCIRYRACSTERAGVRASASEIDERTEWRRIEPARCYAMRADAISDMPSSTNCVERSCRCRRSTRERRKRRRSRHEFERRCRKLGGFAAQNQKTLMPKRTDISSILVIGAGPIIIGQACEFDYSGTQAIKALKEEGYRVVLVNSNPATIMTDPEFADATYVEPITPEIVAKIIAKERPDALLPTMGGQTALNCALALFNDGTLEKYGVQMIGADADAIDKAEDRQRFREAMDKIGLESARSRRGAQRRRGVRGARAHRPAVRSSARASRSAAPAAASPTTAPSSRRSSARASTPRPTTEVLIEESLLGWKEFEMEVVRDKRRQRHHHLLDRERRPDGRAHRRFDHRRPGADADRQGIPDHAQRQHRGAARDRRRDRRFERPVRGQSRRTGG